VRLNRAVSFDTLIVTNVSANFTRSRRIGASKPQPSTAFTHSDCLESTERNPRNPLAGNTIFENGHYPDLRTQRCLRGAESWTKSFRESTLTDGLLRLCSRPRSLKLVGSHTGHEGVAMR